MFKTIGFAGRSLSNVSIAERGVPLEVRLSLSVRIVDQANAALRGAPVAMEATDDVFGATTRVNGLSTVTAYRSYAGALERVARQMSTQDTNGAARALTEVVTPEALHASHRQLIADVTRALKPHLAPDTRSTYLNR